MNHNIRFYSFYRDLNKFSNLKIKHKDKTQRKKKDCYRKVLELCNEYIEIYFNQYITLLNAQKKIFGNKYNPINLFLDICDYNVWFENEKSTDKTSRKSDQEEFETYLTSHKEKEMKKK